MNPLQKIDRFLEKLEKILIVIIFSGFTSIMLFNIVTRNLFDISFQKIIEVVPTLVLWLALLGSTLALKHQRHIRLELILRFCPKKIRSGAHASASFFGMIIMGILFFTSIEFVKNEIQIFGSWGVTAVIFPLFFLLSAFRFASFSIEHLKKYNLD